VLLVIFGINAGFSGVCLAKCWIILEERWEEYRGHVRKPFASIGYRAGGKWMKILCSFCMNITFFGGATVYLLLCSELIHSITHTFIKNLTFCDWIPIMAIILLPLTWLGSPEDFWPAAFGALGATIIGCILLLINIITDSSQKANDVQYDSPTFQSFFLGLGIITFSFGGAGAFPTFQNDMKDKRKFPLAVSIGFGGILLFKKKVCLYFLK
jgi:vesicular inhibitory amino acid transporter